jgi:hypothetical protein
MDFSDFMESDRAAKKRDPKEYARGVAADEKQVAKAHAKTAEGLSERQARVELLYGSPDTSENKKARAEQRVKDIDSYGKDTERAYLEAQKSKGGGGGAGTPKVGAKRTPEFKKGGKVSSASSRADGCAVKGKTKGRMV